MCLRLQLAVFSQADHSAWAISTCSMLECAGTAYDATFAALSEQPKLLDTVLAFHPGQQHPACRDLRSMLQTLPAGMLLHSRHVRGERRALPGMVAAAAAVASDAGLAERAQAWAKAAAAAAHASAAAVGLARAVAAANMGAAAVAATGTADHGLAAAAEAAGGMAAALGLAEVRAAAAIERERVDLAPPTVVCHVQFVCAGPGPSPTAPDQLFVVPC